MMKTGRSAAFIGLLVLSGCASPGTQASGGAYGDTITVSRRPWFAICAGLCPNYDVTVQADGRLWSVRHAYDVPDRVSSARISSAALARFRSILAPYRPAPEAGEPSACRHEASAQTQELIVEAREIDVKWSGAGTSAHLIACDTPENAALRGAIAEALRAVHLDPAGEPD
jgi:hypothetical protein